MTYYQHIRVRLTCESSSIALQTLDRKRTPHALKMEQLDFYTEVCSYETTVSVVVTPVKLRLWHNYWNLVPQLSCNASCI